MGTEAVFSIFGILYLGILFLVNKYEKQRIAKCFFYSERKILSKIQLFESAIAKRQVALNSYDFQLYNLEEALLEQNNKNS